MPLSGPILSLAIFWLFKASTIRAHPVQPGSAGQWAPLSPLPLPRQEHSTVAVNDSTLAVVGGVHPIFDNSSVAAIGAYTTASVQLYDIPSDRWRDGPDAPFAVNHPNVITVDGDIYLLGGLVDRTDPPSQSADWVATGRSAKYHACNNSWTELESTPPGMERGSAIIGAYDGLIYLAGGMTVLNAAYQDAVDTVIAFNISSSTWQRVPEDAATIPEGRQHGAGAVIGHKFYVVGGRWFEKSNLRGSVFVLDLLDMSAGWSEAPDQMPMPRGGISSAVVGNEIFCFGGEANSNAKSGVFPQAEAYNVETGVWRTLQNMPTPRHGTSATSVGNDIYIPAGGLQEDGYLVVREDGVISFSNTTAYIDKLSVV